MPDPTDPLRFAAVLFDMDGTLIDTEPAWFQAERATAARFGAQVPAEAYTQLHGLDAPSLVRTLQDRFGLQASAERFLGALHADLEATLAGARPRPNAEAWVRTVAAAERPRALVSNSPHVAIRATLAPHDWADLLPLRVSYEDVPRGKPEPDTYLEAARRLGVDPAACLAIEDSLTGATAAVRAGCTCLFVTNDGEVDAIEARRITKHVVPRLPALAPASEVKR